MDWPPIIMLMISAFLIGFAVGAMCLIREALKPNGYKAENGNRYKLTQL